MWTEKNIMKNSHKCFIFEKNLRSTHPRMSIKPKQDKQTITITKGTSLEHIKILSSTNDNEKSEKTTPKQTYSIQREKY